MNESSSGPDLLNELAYEFAERFRRGERPSLTEYTARYPGLEAEIRDLFPALVVIEQFGSVGGPPAGPHARTATSDGTAPRQLGEYRILREVARGGMGIVYEAVQESLGRHVALKVLPFQSLADANHRERFRREAQAAAKLHHSNIVPVFGVGEHDGVHYFAMQFIQGQSLDSVLHELKRRRRPKAPDEGEPAEAPSSVPPARRDLALTVTLAEGLVAGRFPGKDEQTRDGPGDRPPPGVDPAGLTFRGPGAAQAVVSGDRSDLGAQSDAQYFRSVARVGVQVAEALAYAHQQGIVHRDIKPSNLLLDTRGTVWITDFGLAKAEGTDELTSPGDLVGTLRYMAPERFQGLADPRSDVYSLGLTLYEMATLRPAFAAAERAQLIERMLHAEPPRPRQIDARIPRDLETLILKAIAQEPVRRYQSAGELAEDLQRFLADRPIQARRSRWPERFARWCRRNPVVAGSTIGAAGVLVLMVVVFAISNVRITRGKALTERAYQAEARSRRNLESTLYINRVALAYRECLANNISQAEQLLDQCPTELRGWEWFYCRRLCHDEVLTFRGHGRDVFGLAFSPDDRRIASAGADGTVQLWDTSTGEVLFKVNVSAPYEGAWFGDNALAFSPDGTRIAVACSSDGAIRFLTAESGQELFTLRGRAGAVHFVAFSPDGKRLASADNRHTNHAGIKVWDATKEGRVLLTIPCTALSVKFSPDGTQLASAGWDHVVRLWNARTGEEIRTFEGHEGWIYSVAFSPDGQRLASASEDSTLKLWDVASGREQVTLRGHIGWVRSVAFRPDGERLVSSSEDGAIKLWDARTGRELSALRGHTDGVTIVAFSSDGQRIASASGDQTVKLWNGTGNSRARNLWEGRGWVRSLAFSPDGRWIASGSNSHPALGRLSLWHARTGQLIRVFSGDAGYVISVAFAPDGRWLASGSDKGSALLWDPMTGKKVLKLSGHKAEVNAVAFSPDGRLIATASSDRTVKLWEVATGREVLNFQGHAGRVYGVVFSPDGQWVASAGDEGTVKLWESATGRVRWTLLRSVPWLDGPIFCDHALAFSPDGTRIAAAGRTTDQGRGGDVPLWDVTTGQQLLTLQGHAKAVTTLAFSPDGQRIATGSLDGTLKIWKATTGEEVFSLRAHNEAVTTVDFSPDCQQVASGSFDSTARIWDATPLEQKPIEWDPDQMAADWTEQGATYSRRGQWAEAVRVWEKLVANYPDRPEFRVQLAVGYQQFAGLLASSTDPQVRDPGQAVELAKRAVALAPKEGPFWHTLGEVHYRAGDWKAAIEALTKSMELRNGSNSYDWFLFAMALGQLGDKTQAITWFDKAEQWMRKNRPADDELVRFRAEAAALLDVKEKKN